MNVEEMTGIILLMRKPFILESEINDLSRINNMTLQRPSIAHSLRSQKKPRIIPSIKSFTAPVPLTDQLWEKTSYEFESETTVKTVESKKVIGMGAGNKMMANIMMGAAGGSLLKSTKPNSINQVSAVVNEKVPSCKECGCDSFAPHSFKKNQCNVCYHTHV